MARETIVLTDTAQGTWRERFTANAKQGTSGTPVRLTGGDAWSIDKFPLKGGLSDGVDVVRVNNGLFSMDVLPTRGMGLFRGVCAGLPVEWKSPVAAPVNPMFVNLVERGGLGWLAGFNELLCRCGVDSNGPPGLDVIVNNEGQKTTAELTLHGKIANLPAQFVEVFVDTDGPGTIGVTGIVDETMLFGPCWRMKSTLSTQIGSTAITVVDELTNLKSTPAELEMLYHWNFGRPFLEEGARLVVPALEVAPRDATAVAAVDTWDTYTAPKAGFVEQCYWMQLAGDSRGHTQVLLKNAHGDKGLSLKFNVQQLPCFTVWKNTQAEVDGYVTGLEPGTNYPNPKTVERSHGRVVNVPPAGTYRTETTLEIHPTHDAVTAAEKAVQGLLGGKQTVVHREPQPRYQAKG
jgi:hypothetical protein